MKTILVTITVLVSVFFVGCGGGDNTAVIESDSANTTKIVTRDDASKAIGAVQSMQFDMLASALSQSLQTQLGAQAAPNRVTYPIPYAKQRECSVSGTVNTTGEKSNLFTYHATNVFDNCTHLDNIIVNGTQMVDATLKNNKLVASLSDNNIEVSMGAKSMHLSDPIQLYSNLDFSRIEVILLEDGQILKDETPSQEVFMDINVTLDTKHATMYLNGFTQIYGCGDEGYDIQTIEPLTANLEGKFTSGTLKINGALFKFNSDNTVTVTLTNGDVYTAVQGKEVVCELNPNELQYIRDDVNEVVFDTTTQQMWQDNEVVSRPWLTQENFDAQNWFDTSGDTAATYCSELTLGGYDDWRLPNQVELASLLNENVMIVPTISQVFKHTASSEYWSSESNYERLALTVDFGTASLVEDSKDATHAVRCVRDGVLTTRQQPLNPSTCKGYILESGNDANNNGVLDDDEVTLTMPYYENGTPITREELETKIENNEDVTSVNTCKITDMSRLLLGNYRFNQDISRWNVSGVTDMSEMFAFMGYFNQPLNNWDVSSVTNMSDMFANTNAFNQSLNNWDVSSVTDMSGMFWQSNAFNQPLNSWNVSNVTDMSGMFSEAEGFDQPLNNWDVSSVTNMKHMFSFAKYFNQPLNNWDVSSVTNMYGMFSFVKYFNQPLNNWNVSRVTNMSWMFDGSSLSTANYDAILEDWSRQTLQHNVNFSVGETKYSPSSQAARDIFTNTYHWTISDGGVL